MSEYEDRLNQIGQSAITAAWDPSLHPRARDGQFIEKGGFVRALFSLVGGKKRKLNGRVVGFDKNPSNPKDPIVRVETKEGLVRAPVSNITKAATPKASISKDPLGDAIEKVNAAAETLSTDDPAERMKGLDKIMGGIRGTPLSTAVHENKRGKSRDEWNPQRVEQHEQLWDQFIAKVEAAGIPQEHKALALGGLPGAGKSTSLRPDGAAGELGVIGYDVLEDAPEGATHVVMNPDIIKELMIENNMLPKDISPKIKPMEQVSFIHAESNFLTALFFDRISERGYNVVYDTTMANVPHVKKNLRPLRDVGYSFDGLFVNIPREESRISAARRYLADWKTPQGGRFVPSEAGNNDNRGVFREMTPWFDNWLVVDNTGISKGEPLGEITDRGQGEDPILTRMIEEAARRRAEWEAKKAAEKAEKSLLERTREEGTTASIGDAVEPPISETQLLQVIRNVPENGLVPENIISKIQNGEVFVQDPLDDDADEDDYLVASKLAHEFQAKGWEDHLDSLAQVVNYARSEGMTMSKYIAED